MASQLGVNITDIADTVQVMMSGVHWTDLQSGTLSYPVLLQMKKSDLMSFDSLNHIYVPSSTSSSSDSPEGTTSRVNMIPLSSLISLVPKVAAVCNIFNVIDLVMFLLQLHPVIPRVKLFVISVFICPSVLKAKPMAVSNSTSSLGRHPLKKGCHQGSLFRCCSRLSAVLW